MPGITHTQIHTVHGGRLRTAMVVAAVVAAFALAGVLALALGGGTDAPTAAPPQQPAAVGATSDVVPGLRYDGGPDEGSRGLVDRAAPNPGRPDGGPEEGSRGPGH